MMRFTAKYRAFLLLLLFTAACDIGAASDGPQIPATKGKEDGPATRTKIDLISKATCESYRKTLRNCKIEASTLLKGPVDLVVPARTVIRRSMVGNCTTAYPLQLTLSSPELAEPRSFAFLAEEALVVRSRAGTPLKELTLKDESPWTKFSSFAEGCTIDATVALNEPDVDTSLEAQGALALIERELGAARVESATYKHLLLLLAAHDFLYALATHLHDELTGDLMRELRKAHEKALPAFEELAASKPCQQALGASHLTLIRLSASFTAITDQDKWFKKDGKPKTLAELYTELRGEGVVAQVQALARESDPKLAVKYRASYEAAVKRVVEQETRLKLAREQLRPWLDKKDGGK